MKQTLLILSLFAALPAHAKCMTPAPYVLPRPGSVLPPNPTLYFFVPPAGRGGSEEIVKKLRALSSTGARLPMTVKTLEGGGELQVLRLEVVAPAGTKFRLDPMLNLPASWKVEAGALSNEPLVLERGEDLSRSWTCSYEASRVLNSSLAAPAYRVEFAETEELLRAGTSRSVVVEGDNDGFLRPGGETAPPAPRRAVRLGHHDCWGANLKWETPRLAIRVTALLADGSERKAESIFVLDAPPARTGTER